MVAASDVAGQSSVVERAANGRSKDAFNAYQRAYMQAKRAIAAGRASAWPRNV